MKYKILFLLSTIAISSAYANEKQCWDDVDCIENQSYAKVMEQYKALEQISKTHLDYDKDALNNLRQSQKSWLKYREDYCVVYSSNHGEKNNHANCIIELNNQRAKQLENDVDAS